jgi:hypothetical protein
MPDFVRFMVFSFEPSVVKKSRTYTEEGRRSTERHREFFRLIDFVCFVDFTFEPSVVKRKSN